MAIHSKHLEALEASIATAFNIVKNRTLADLYVRRDYVGDCRIRVQIQGGQRYVITIKKDDAEYCSLVGVAHYGQVAHSLPGSISYFDCGQRPAARSSALLASRS